MTGPRTSLTSSSGCGRSSCPTSSSRSAISPRRRSGRSPASRGCRFTTSPKARKSASCRTTITWRSCASGGPSIDTAGPIVDEDGTVLGTHEGIEGFTIGQRRGWASRSDRLATSSRSSPRPGRSRVGRRESLERIGLEANRFNWQGPEPRAPVRCLAQIRARHEAVPATVEPLARRPGPRRLRLSPDGRDPGTGGHGLPGRPGAWGGMDRQGSSRQILRP